MKKSDRINITVSPKGSLELLSHSEVERLRDTSESGIHELLRRCSIAVLNCGAQTDNTKEILEEFNDFDIHLIKKDWGLQLELTHAVIVFPGGPGSIEEILYILGVLLHPENKGINFPLFFTGPATSKAYFQMVHDFIGATLGFQAQQLYKIIIDDPKQVADEVKVKIDEVMHTRRSQGDSFFFNWHLKISREFQKSFRPSHDNMAGLKIRKDMEPQHLAANLRRAFSGIVAGNIKDEGIRAVEKNGPYKLNGDADIMEKLGLLLSNLVKQQRMKLPGSDYIPCYKIV